MVGLQRGISPRRHGCQPSINPSGVHEYNFIRSMRRIDCLFGHNVGGEAREGGCTLQWLVSRTSGHHRRLWCIQWRVVHFHRNSVRFAILCVLQRTPINEQWFRFYEDWPHWWPPRCGFSARRVWILGSSGERTGAGERRRCTALSAVRLRLRRVGHHPLDAAVFLHHLVPVVAHRHVESE